MLLLLHCFKTKLIVYDAECSSEVGRHVVGPCASFIVDVSLSFLRCSWHCPLTFYHLPADLGRVMFLPVSVCFYFPVNGHEQHYNLQIYYYTYIVLCWC